MAYPYQFKQCNKADWARGPWDDETDSAEWRDSLTGYDCAMIRHSTLGHWCGYVCVPDEHPLHGVAYNQRVKVPAGWMQRSVKIDEDIGIIPLFCSSISMNEEMTEATLELLLFCHGGLTFSKKSWLGFDCGHAGDLSPYTKRIFNRGDLGKVYRDAVYVRSNVERLAKQIHDYAVEMGRL